MAVEINKKKLASSKARKAQREMLEYMQKYDLDPNKDWTKDKKHGKKIQAWIDVINLGNKKSKELSKEKAEEKRLKKPDVHPKVKRVSSAPNVYDYPTINGQEMSQELKKKYRQKMRSLIKTMNKEKAEKKAKEYAEELLKNKSKKAEKVEKEPVKTKKVEKAKPVEKKAKEKHKKVNKKKVEED